MLTKSARAVHTQKVVHMKTNIKKRLNAFPAGKRSAQAPQFRKPLVCISLYRPTPTTTLTLAEL